MAAKANHGLALYLRDDSVICHAQESAISVNASVSQSNDVCWEREGAARLFSEMRNVTSE